MNRCCNLEITNGNRRAGVAERRGAVLVEFAMVAPLLFMMIFLFTEFDRYIFAVHALEEAARGGCRAAILEDATMNEVEDEIAKILKPSGIQKYSQQVTPVLDGNFQQGDLITVTVSASYQDVSWLPALRFLQNKTILASCALPKEG